MDAGVKMIRGEVAPLVGCQGRVCIVDGECEYRVVPRGAGVDLAIHISKAVEVTGQVSENDDGVQIFVRTYRVVDIDDDAWYQDDKDPSF